MLEDDTLLFGNEKLMKERNIDISDYVEKAQGLASEAKTPMYFAVNSSLVAVIAVADPIKTDSIDAIKRLQNNGIRVVMLTGDNRSTAKAVAEKAGITEFVAEVMPEEKANKVIWNIKGENSLKEKMLNAIFGIDLEKEIRPMYQQGLKNLNSVVRQELNKYTVSVDGVLDTGGSYYLYMSTSATTKTMETLQESMFQKLFQILRSKTTRSALAGV